MEQEHAVLAGDWIHPERNAAPATATDGVDLSSRAVPARSWRSTHTAGRRYRADGKRFVKTGGESLEHEWQMLARAQGLAGVPEPLDLVLEDGEPALALRRIEGCRIDLVEQNPWALLRTGLQAAGIVIRLAGRGVSHNDLRPENLILGTDGRLGLVDFGRAQPAARWACLAAGLLGLRAGGLHPCFGLPELVRSWIRDRLPPRIVCRLNRQPPERADAGPLGEVDEPALRDAWRLGAAADASSPGRKVAYYGLSAGSLELPGERPFGPRWRAIRDAVDVRGRRVLELGCNMALLSTWLLREGAAAAVLAVDRDPQVLAAARLVARACHVEPAFRAVDLDGLESWEEDLAAFAPDVVFALSLANWVQDPQRLLAFLARFPEVIFEGHGSALTERRRLLAAGFDDVERICISERGRTLLRCRRYGGGRPS